MTELGSTPPGASLPLNCTQLLGKDLFQLIDTAFPKRSFVPRNNKSCVYRTGSHQCGGNKLHRGAIIFHLISECDEGINGFLLRGRAWLCPDQETRKYKLPVRRLNIIKAGSYTRLPATRRPPTLKNTTDNLLIAIVLFLVLVPQSASAGGVGIGARRRLRMGR